MTMVRKGPGCLQQRKLLLVQDGWVTLSHNLEETTGNAVSVIAAVLLDIETTDAFVAGVRLYDTLAQLNQLMKTVPGWQMRFTNRRRYAFDKDGKKCVTGRFFVDYFCVDQKIGPHNGRRARKRIDVINLDLLREKPPKHAQGQLDMALAILEMCDNRGIKYKTTRGALGSAMLKASPFWTKGRYAVPKFINDSARPYLPGNFYALSSKVEKRGIRTYKHCYYIDQSSSHHNIASQISLPDPQTIHARGRWKSLQGRWIDPSSNAGQEILTGESFGLYLCKMQISTIPPSKTHLYPPWVTRGKRLIWLWSPEFRLFTDPRLQLEYFIAGFSTTMKDEVLPEYATWSLEEIARNPQLAKYKKGSLLAAYGMLAFNSVGKPIYRYWGGENSRPKCEIPIAGTVAESRLRIPDNVQLSTVNVIARGLIEAETRTRSIEYARELTDQGFHVPQIYADGILVETDSLPFIPNGWRVSHSLTNVQIPRANAIISDQMVKLPGVAGSEQDREWEERRRGALQPLVLN